jgi:hypothetical protein
MTDTYTSRCEILAKWLEVRNDIMNIKRVYEGMSSTHNAYKEFQEMIEEKRHILDVMQRKSENPWLEDVLMALEKGT